MSATPASGQTGLARGNIGWVLLTALGVSYVIAGDYAAWNYGLATSGWGGLMAALALMAMLYLCLLFCLAELAAAIPTSGGGYAFVRRAFGPMPGFAVGFCVAIEYVALSAVIGIFLASYFEALTGLKGLWILAGFYALFLSLHLCGVGEALRILLALAGLAVVGIIVFLAATLPHFSFDRLMSGSASVPPGALPFGISGIVAGLPFGMAMFLAVEGLPLASEEARDPERNIPIAMVLAWIILGLMATAILFAAPGAAGLEPMIATDRPLIATMLAVGAHSNATIAVNVAGLVALAASFFSTLYAFSRQLFALSRAGYLPGILARTNRRHSPWVALLIPGAVAFAASAHDDAELLVLVAVFCATFSYLLMLGAFLKLRSAEPALHRPYRAPGGVLTAIVGLALALCAFVSSLTSAPLGSLMVAGLVVIALAYFHLYARHRPVALLSGERG